ncbi:hypothetical protein IGS68_35005 (plasmid) [Skermanella sp. TT6]|uniref:KTSC domain-containing protein n=1 Tax=Skermanella cutis TaxID=2775420 RepID=A0ABX7BHZ9_9PROT|nr:hypothetical protein [Skermanella sp. TT6]QQP93989.1 hypothetical protein IGS68_35005 [Skermanella sp. TT6]
MDKDRLELDRCILEVDGSAAGILLLDGNDAYRFFATEPATAVLEGRTFRTPQRAEAAIRRVLRRGQRDP